MKATANITTPAILAHEAHESPGFPHLVDHGPTWRSDPAAVIAPADFREWMGTVERTKRHGFQLELVGCLRKLGLPIPTD